MLEGNVKDINPELLMDEQCDSMPYDKRWEFPKYRLKLGWFNVESKVLVKLSKQWPSKWSDPQQTSPQWKLL
jgi:hypothetical protein